MTGPSGAGNRGRCGRRLRRFLRLVEPAVCWPGARSRSRFAAELSHPLCPQGSRRGPRGFRHGGRAAGDPAGPGDPGRHDADSGERLRARGRVPLRRGARACSRRDPAHGVLQGRRVTRGRRQRPARPYRRAHRARSRPAAALDDLLLRTLRQRVDRIGPPPLSTRQVRGASGSGSPRVAAGPVETRATDVRSDGRPARRGRVRPSGRAARDPKTWAGTTPQTKRSAACSSTAESPSERPSCSCRGGRLSRSSRRRSRRASRPWRRSRRLPPSRSIWRGSRGFSLRASRAAARSIFIRGKTASQGAPPLDERRNHPPEKNAGQQQESHGQSKCDADGETGEDGHCRKLLAIRFRLSAFSDSAYLPADS
jgi:hypothetical protein